MFREYMESYFVGRKTMKLQVYKGFDEQFLSRVMIAPLLKGAISRKKNVLSFDRGYRKQLERALLDMDEGDTRWATYEEYALIKTRVDDAMEFDELRLEVIQNNLYPEYYLIPFSLTEDLVKEIQRAEEDTSAAESGSEEYQRFSLVYNTLLHVNGTYYGSFYNYEYEQPKQVQSRAQYPEGQFVGRSLHPDFQLFLNEDIEKYLWDLAEISALGVQSVGVRTTGGEVSRRLLHSFLAYAAFHHIRVEESHELLKKEAEQEKELMQIAREDIGIRGFSAFRDLPFYKTPDINKEVVQISQGQIIRNIIQQAENAYHEGDNPKARDIFITASTGAGKSMMFQIPAVYLAKKYGKLTIIIEPVKALMQDQKDKLNACGYNRVETFNSDLITQVEKERVLQRIKAGEVDLLYLSPETLLSYSIETIIGDREIGLLIVDEAHIVTTWGVGFRPDYWYLGSYINRLRHQIQYGKNRERKVYHFPICAFTATAINGGPDDSVGETIISLYMENPIKYIGYTRREDIHFQITKKSMAKLSKSDYEEAKTRDLSVHLKEWITKKEKTIVYFPYASMVGEAKQGSRGFAEILTNGHIEAYTGRNIDGLSREAFNAQKRDAFERFRTGQSSVMYATKAFGMGVDIDDIQNVYHYAATGNLCDYVQEIGRAARKNGMEGFAITDFYANDMTFMKVLFGMSRVHQYQVQKVLEGVYRTYKNKKESRNFLISPESFTYIFSGNEDANVNQLKTCLLMLEKDFYDKYNFKVLISRPQSVFTKAFVVVQKEFEKKVLDSRYGRYFHLIQKGRDKVPQADGCTITDMGSVYALDLKQIWEEFHPNISFPQFKYWYFNKKSAAANHIAIMEEIRDYIFPRQRISVESQGEYLSSLRDRILGDFETIGDLLYNNFSKGYFTIDDFIKLLTKPYGKSKARIIANSLFELVDPNGTCIKHRNSDKNGRTMYVIANGNFKEYLRKPITNAKVINDFYYTRRKNYSSYMCFTEENERWSILALKLLSIFGYITYEIAGGEEPEIFIRLNDPSKIKGIVMGTIPYRNGYVTRAGKKHTRDVDILRRFFTDLTTDKERWDYIEDYFLGHDVLDEKRRG